jgi:thioredoxin reductase
VFEKNRIGGLLLNANLVENYPGFPEGISGQALAGLFADHLRRVKVDVRTLEVLSLEKEGATANGGADIRIETDRGAFRSRAAVVATGTRAKMLSIPVPVSARERVLYEIHDILDVEEQTIVVVGAGDAAFDYALNLARKKNEVVILNRSTRRSCLPLLWERARADEQIRYEEDIEVRNVDFSEGKLKLQCRQEGGERSVTADFLVVAVGRLPETGCLSEEVRAQLAPLEDQGRLHLVGDVVRGHYRQTAIAVGDGLHAAMSICGSLKGDR